MPPHSFLPEFLHCFLLVCERDVHFLQSDLVECARNLQTFCLLILAQAFASRIIKLSYPFPE